MNQTGRQEQISMSTKQRDPGNCRAYNAHALYSQVGFDADEVYAQKKRYHRRNILVRITERFAAADPLRVLEFGPGMGCMIDLIGEHFKSVEYHLVDIDEKQLDRLRQRFPAVASHYVSAASELKQLTVSLPDFDVIVAVDVWEHLPPDEVVEYTAWCLSQLAPGGLMILQVPNWACPVTPHAVYASDLTHHILFNEHSARQLLSMAGAQADEVEIRGRMSPGILGAIRDSIRSVYLFFYRSMYVLMGTVRLTVLEPDLLMVFRKRPNR